LRLPFAEILRGSVLFKNNKLLCYGNSDTIDWSYIIAEDEKFEYIDSDKLGCESLVEISLFLSFFLSLSLSLSL